MSRVSLGVKRFAVVSFVLAAAFVVSQLTWDLLLDRTFGVPASGNVSVRVNLGDGRVARMMVTVPENENVYLDFDLPSGDVMVETWQDTIPAACVGTMAAGSL